MSKTNEGLIVDPNSVAIGASAIIVASILGYFAKKVFFKTKYPQHEQYGPFGGDE